MVLEAGAATAETATDSAPVLVLKLQQAPKITWTEDTVDNENLGRKSSKRCCIFHKIKKFGESDSDETDSDAGEGDDGERGAGSGPGGSQGPDASDAAGSAPAKKAKGVAPHLRHHA